MSAVESAPAAGRFNSIDQVRGMIMILMALDHVRWFFTDISGYQPETLASTNLCLFLTRWVTHFCAPGFFFLAGIAVCLYGTKLDNARKLRGYLLSRGIFLMCLEFTIVGYSWVFTPGYSFGGVIWSLGFSFVAMAALVTVRRTLLLTGSGLFLLLHNELLSRVEIVRGEWATLLWRALYEPGSAVIPLLGKSYFFLFPVIPWLAMMVLGFVLGDHYRRPLAERRALFARAGTAMIVAFLALRLSGSFGNTDTLWISPSTAGDFSVQQDLVSSVISLLNAEKYPPSLQFTLMTLGPILLWLGLSRMDAASVRPDAVSKALVVMGRVPLFYYICHLYLIHGLALIVTSVAGQPNDWIAFGASPGATRLPGYGFGLPVIYVAWAASTLVLYRICVAFEAYKRTRSYAWLRYL